MTLRRRLFAYLALAAVASCALTTAVAVVLVRHRVAVTRTRALEAQADNVAYLDEAPGARVYRVVDGRARRLAPRRAAAVLAQVPSAAPAQGTATVAGRPLLYVVRAAARGRVVLVGSAAIAFAQWRPFLVSLVLAGVGGACLAGVLGLLLARRFTRPIAALARATGRLAAGARDVAVPIRGEDELAALGRSFNRMAAELTRARAAQQNFLESVSHELRTPLTSIRGYAEALAEEAVAAPGAAAIIGAESSRLERLVEDLLELARLGREGFSVARTEVDLPSVAARALARHAPAAAELGVTLSADGEGEARPGVLGDEDRIAQVLSNLIENALRLTPRGGRVTVAWRTGELAVSDTGPGIAAPDLARAFDRFYLHDRYRSERPVGSGLGLAIVHDLVAAMGGTTEAYSPARGQAGGAEFVVRLPTGPAD